MTTSSVPPLRQKESREVSPEGSAEEKSGNYGGRLCLLGMVNTSAQGFTEVLLIPVEIFQ